jgi:hypothetical protein
MGRKILNTTPVASEPVAKRQPRNATLLVAECAREGSVPFALRIRNLSASGLCGHFTGAADILPDVAARITFPHVEPIPARVVWQDGNQLGIQFLNPIDLQSIAGARAATAIAAPVTDARTALVLNWMGLASAE